MDSTDTTKLIEWKGNHCVICGGDVMESSQPKFKIYKEKTICIGCVNGIAVENWINE